MSMRFGAGRWTYLIWFESFRCDHSYEAGLDRAMKIAGIWHVRRGSLPAANRLSGRITVFVEDYQRRHPVSMPHFALAMLRHLMEQHDMNAPSWAVVVGSQSNASLICRANARLASGDPPVERALCRGPQRIPVTV